MDQLVNVCVQKDGQVWIVLIVLVQKIFMVQIVQKSVSVQMKIPKVVIHGLEFVIVNQVGVQFYVIVLVQF